MLIESPLNNIEATGGVVRVWGGIPVDCLGVMSYDDEAGMPKSWYEETRNEGNGGGITVTYPKAINTRTPRRCVDDYIGEEFWVFRAQNTRMYLGTLLSYDKATGEFRFSADTDLPSDTSWLLDTGTFLTATNAVSVMITRENLAAFFANPNHPRRVRSYLDRDLSISGKTLKLTYRDAGDDKPLDDSIGFAHSFNITTGGNITWHPDDNQISGSIYEPFDDGDPKSEGAIRLLP